MRQTLMQGLTEKDMQAVVNTYNLKPFYYPTLFPLKQTYTLTWKSLEGQVGLRIAADLVARGATLDKKTRDVVARIQGDIPKVAIKRTKDENELNDYDIMVAMSSSNPDLKALVEAWAEDTQFCWNGVAARLEWMALQTISRGKITVTNSNNSGVVTEFDVDYKIPNAQKKGFATDSAAWSNKTSAKPLTVDFKNIIAEAKKKGISLKYAFMNLDTFAVFSATEEVVKMTASFAQNALNIAQTPSVEQVNNAIKGIGYLRGVQIVIIDQEVTIEKANGDRVTVNPFEDDVVMFNEQKVLGKTYWKTPADMNLQSSVAIKAMNGHTLIKKFSEEEPLEEITIGLANAFPAWENSSRAYFLNTENKSWK